ncbi:MAG: type VI secretion system baseplate subunit TssF [Lentisphaeraceae bacterium]|nr:type VI secretion system baseplate subunit TssF [Lentisphaeraceae bacterium]
MDQKFLTLYQQELQHIRDMGGDFAKRFPKVAGRLNLDEFECADPYVERLLEGFAFLAARVQLKIDAEFPRFSEALLDNLLPNYLAPSPAMMTTVFNPDLTEGDLASGYKIPRGTELRSRLDRGVHTPCIFTTAHDVTLWPLEITQAEYHTQDLPKYLIPSTLKAKSALRFQIKLTGDVEFSDLELDELDIFLDFRNSVSVKLYEQLFANSQSVYVQQSSLPIRFQQKLPKTAIKSIGFADDEALLPVEARSFQGYRLLHEYFSLPERFLYFRISGLKEILQRVPDDMAEERSFDIVIPFSEHSHGLEHQVGPENFKLFCTPSINLFKKRTDRINISDKKFEHHVVVDRTRPLDYEVFRVNNVEAYGTKVGDEQHFKAFYSIKDKTHDELRGNAYYSLRRCERRISDRERRIGQRSNYLGTDTFISLVDASQAPYSSDLRELTLETLCTNRDLTLQLSTGLGRTDFSIDTSAPLDSIRCLGKISSPKMAHLEGSDVTWRGISHMTQNYTTLINSNDGSGATALRELLGLYCDPKSTQQLKQIEGITKIFTKPVTRRIMRGGRISFVQGLEINVMFDELAYSGFGIFLMGKVLDHFFSRYVTINSFTETVIHSTDRGEVIRWAARTGQQKTL